jgi:single-strand DNA-binding protein
MYQKYVIIGNLGADPELRYTPSGQAYTQFSLAANREWTNNDTGEEQKETTWFRIVVWGKQAESCHEYLSKGRRVLVEGERLRVSPYLKRDGQPAASLELTARTVRFMDNKGSNGGSMPEAAGELPAADPEQDEFPF